MPPTDACDVQAGLASWLAESVAEWYGAHARDLPWRRTGVGAWQVLVSEVMLQQTPVARVEPAWRRWVARWPSAAALAAEPSGEAVRAWGRLGYPRRALRLHAAAGACVERHGGTVPASVSELEALPGVGAYTARAVAAFAYGARVPVVDVNVRRVVARAIEGQAAGPPAVTARDLALVDALLPPDGAAPPAPRVSVALMELGALVCTARSPLCGVCPLRARCRWRLAGAPPAATPGRRSRGYAGTDRFVRGRLLAVLREAAGPVTWHALEAVWDEPVQRARALDGLRDDGLAVCLSDGTWALPGGAGEVPQDATAPP